MRARRGALLPITLFVLLFLMILCPVVLGMADMNVRYNNFFEPRNILEQATVSFTHVLFDEISAEQDMPTWLADDAKWSGTYAVTPEGGDGAPMAFTYTIDGKGHDEYELFVKGEYTTLPEIPPIVISVDLTVSRDIWQRITK
jgi:hypothetical protein